MGCAQRWNPEIPAPEYPYSSAAGDDGAWCQRAEGVNVVLRLRVHGRGGSEGAFFMSALGRHSSW